MVDAGGGVRSTSRRVLRSTGRRSPTPYSSTRSGSPVSGSAQMSTWAMLVALSAGRRRTPAASIPATRRAGSWDSSSARTPCSISRARVGGSRSDASGSRISETGEIVAVSDSKTQRIMLGPRRIRSVSPVLRIRSIRQSSAARHHTRRSLSSPSSWASPTNESLSGSCRGCPRSRRDPTSRRRRRPGCAGPGRRGLTPGSAAGRAVTATGMPISAAAVTSTTSQRAVMAPL